VVFESDATDLRGTGMDLNDRNDVYAYDFDTTVMSLVSLTVDDDQIEGGNPFDHMTPAVSSDGRYVLFNTSAPNLLGPGGDPNESLDCFVRDLSDGRLHRVSVAFNGEQLPAGGSSEPAFSADGDYVAFYSASPATPGDLDGSIFGDTFVVDWESL
jgi:Tol biopolymer transport system component